MRPSVRTHRGIGPAIAVATSTKARIGLSRQHYCPDVLGTPLKSRWQRLRAVFFLELLAEVELQSTSPFHDVQEPSPDTPGVGGRVRERQDGRTRTAILARLATLLANLIRSGDGRSGRRAPRAHYTRTEKKPALMFCRRRGQPGHLSHIAGENGRRRRPSAGRHRGSQRVQRTSAGISDREETWLRDRPCGVTLRATRGCLGGSPRHDEERHCRRERSASGHRRSPPRGRGYPAWPKHGRHNRREHDQVLHAQLREGLPSKAGNGNTAPPVGCANTPHYLGNLAFNDAYLNDPDFQRETASYF